MSLSSSGLGHRPFTAVTGVRVSVGTPLFLFFFILAIQYFPLYELMPPEIPPYSQ